MLIESLGASPRKEAESGSPSRLAAGPHSHRADLLN